MRLRRRRLKITVGNSSCARGAIKRACTPPSSAGCPRRHVPLSRNVSSNPASDIRRTGTFAVSYRPCDSNVRRFARYNERQVVYARALCPFSSNVGNTYRPPARRSVTSRSLPLSFFFASPLGHVFPRAVSVRINDGQLTRATRYGKRLSYARSKAAYDATHSSPARTQNFNATVSRTYRAI